MFPSHDRREREFVSRDDGAPAQVKMLDKHCLAPSLLRLKVGAVVMLLANVDVHAGLANGSMGVVTGYTQIEKRTVPVVKFYNGCETPITRHAWEIKEGDVVIAERRQIPLRLAWAVTAHKSQGCTFDKARVHLGRVFEDGQAYVALSRVRTLGGLYIMSGKKANIHASQRAVEFYESGGAAGVPQPTTEGLLI